MNYFLSREKTIKSKGSNEIKKLHKYILDLEEKQICDQKIFLRKCINANIKAPYTCTSCLLQFSDENTLNLHKNYHLLREDKIIVPKMTCRVCKVKYTDKSKFESHLLSEEHVKSSLFHPKVVIDRDPKIKKFMNNHYSKSIRKCNICMKVFYDRELYEKHIKFHKTGSIYECPNCFKPLSNIKMMNKHKIFHSKQERRFRCFTCNKQSTKYGTLLAHLENSLCGRKNKKSKKKPESIQAVVCQICFEDSRNILSHVKTHTTGFQYECYHCLRGFADKDSLSRHKADHKKGFQCKNCHDDNIRTFEMLLDHLKFCRPKPDETADTDSDQSPDLSVSCKVCLKRILTPSLLRAHMRVHSTGEKFECCFCLLGFEDEILLQEHKRTHDTKNSYLCNYCRTKFKNSAELLSHFMETQHRDLVPDTLQPGPRQDLEFIERNSDSVNNADYKSSKRLAESKKIVSPRWYYECPLCRNNLKHNKEAFNTHIKLHRSVCKTVCKFCLMEFSDEEGLMDHLKERHKDKVYMCPYGDFTSISHSAVLLHFELTGHAPLGGEEVSAVKLLMFENKTYGQDNLFEGHKTLDCQVCHEELESFVSLNIHLRLHSGQSTYECRFCFEKFEVLEEQQQHVREAHQKTNKLKYFCPKCKYSSDDKNALIIHARSVNHLFEHYVPTREKNDRSANIYTTYKSKEAKECQICFMNLEGERSLKSHQKFHVTNFPFECSQCLMGFADKNKARLHRKIHLNSFECLNCSDEFDTYVRYTKHLEDTNHHRKYQNSYENHLAAVSATSTVAEDNIVEQVAEDTNIMSDCDLTFNLGSSHNLDIEDELCKSLSLSQEDKIPGITQKIFEGLRFSDSDEDFSRIVGSFEFDSNYSDSSQSLRHVREKDKVIQYLCESCYFQCSNPMDFFDPNKHPCSSDHMLLCRLCNLPLGSGTSLQDHLDTHHKDEEKLKMFKIKVCGVCSSCIDSPQENCILGKFYQLTQQHIDSISCNICLGLVKFEHLYEHLQFHSCLLPHACKHCYHEFDSQSQLKSHLDVCEAHSKNVYRCFSCDHLETGSDQLSKHLTIRHQEMSRINQKIKTEIQNIFQPSSIEGKSGLHIPELEDSSQGHSDSLLQADNSKSHHSYIQTLISQRKSYIEKVEEMAKKNSENGVTFDMIEDHFNNEYEKEGFKHSVNSYIEAALLQGRIMKLVKGDEEIFFPVFRETRCKERLKRCGECFPCLKDDCGNCKSWQEGEKSDKKGCLRRKRCQKLKRLKTYDNNLAKSITSILSEGTSVLKQSPVIEASRLQVEEKDESANSESRPCKIVVPDEPPALAVLLTAIEPTDENKTSISKNNVSEDETNCKKEYKDLENSLSNGEFLNMEETSKTFSIDEIENRQFQKSVNLDESSSSKETIRKKIPIYRTIPKIQNEEFSSVKFIKRVSSINTKERKIVERRKFGSLNTKFQGRKSFESGTKIEDNDPFSIEINEHEHFQLPLKTVVQSRPIMERTSVEKSNRESGERERFKREEEEHFVKSEVMVPSFERSATFSSTLVENIEEIRAEVKRQKQKKKKSWKISRPISTNPSCPHCFKFLLNPDKMRSHTAECKANSDLAERPIKLTIRLSSDREKVEFK